jgi:hypothetical protein
MGAMMQCTMGAAPASLIVTSQQAEKSGGMLAATIMDHAPMTNIPTFGMCMSIANPTVASATSAAMGVLTPMPCIPATSSPWTPGSPTHKIGNFLALNDTSKCMCNWNGVISITFPGQVTEDIP